MSSQSPSLDSQTAKRRQMQERRRTLQTISELSATEAMSEDFKAAIVNAQMAVTDRASIPSHGRKTANLSKRQSLPKYCGNPDCAQAQSDPRMPSKYLPPTQRTLRGHEIQPSPSPRHEAGWNARRERARMQAEQALSGTNIHRESSWSSLRAGRSSTQPIVPPLPLNKSSHPHLRAYYSQQHLLRNSHSKTSIPPQSEPHSGSSSSPRSPRLTDMDVDSSERTSTDSNSFHSSFESAVRGPRSSASSQSFTLLGVPPLPTGGAQPVQPYYTALTSHYHNGYPYQLPGPMYAKIPSEMTTSAVPFMRLDHANTFLRGRDSGQGTGSPFVAQHHNYNQSQGMRPQFVSACTMSALETRSSRSSFTSQPSRRSTTRPRPPSNTTRRSRSRSRSSLKSAHPPSRSVHSVTFDQAPSPHALTPPSKRTLPDRESLTRWKAEREEAKVEHDGVHRASTAERVRRANEMEWEKERELQAVGKGAEKGARVLGKGLVKKKERRGCFAVLFRWGRGR
ncbi:hypothetical protein GQ44DRAFT_775624 [Phaeosphaeriaceae sp. PMI808]|nr:hypothetical protein GQ44DRAFT_775624 [Phaeosphaeriaceae sp. PMI808]